MNQVHDPCKAFGKVQSSYEKFVISVKEGASCYVEWMRRCNLYFCLAIAHAMMKDASIIILDEATANVDPENERELTAAIEA